MWYTYGTEYYSAIKNDEIMPSVATWMDLEVVILSDERLRDREKETQMKATVLYHLILEEVAYHFYCFTFLFIIY